MESTGTELQKDWQQQIKAGGTALGTIGIRVIVLPPKSKDGQPLSVAETDGEPELEVGVAPLDSYLEKPGGKGYVVFLVHGQRHDTLDEWFVGRDLGFKYLRKRTMVIVDVDGLAPEAIGELVQGSRQEFYKGDIYYALLDRLTAVLKNDPELKRMEAEAEQEIAELKTGDEAVRSKLDQLIEGHHAAAMRAAAGAQATQPTGGQAGTGQDVEQDAVMGTTPEVGEAAMEPVLLSDPSGAHIRLYPGEERHLGIRCDPPTFWNKLQQRDFRIAPQIQELAVEATENKSGASVKFLFSEPEDFPEEDYPLTATFTFRAVFEGSQEPRVLEREIVIARKHRRPPPPPPVLRDVPTFLKVISRQPVKLIPGGPLTHVRLRWDGKDELAAGQPPDWSFRGNCISLASFPAPVFSLPRKGNLEVLLETPHGLLTSQHLEFEVEAVGPNGRMLSARFKGEVEEPPPQPEPRKLKGQAPEGSPHRRPPYDLKKVTEPEWNSPTCWNSSNWTKDDAGCFHEPADSKPLTLIINEDAELLRTARDQMLERKLEDKTIQERMTRYTAHIAFHLYQMFLDWQRLMKEKETDESVHVPSDGELRAEINRVAATLLQLMDR